MRIRGVEWFAIGLVVAVPVFSALAKEKEKQGKSLPPYVLTAHTVAVIVDPSAGVDPDDPRANQVAQKDVETALANWGRFVPVMAAQDADVVIVIRKGHGHLVDQTINDPRQNSRVGVINPTANGVQIGAQHGQYPNGQIPGQTSSTDELPPPGQPPGMPAGGPQTEMGGVLDSFSVYEGHKANPAEWPAAWRRVEKNGLHSHDVPVVDEFRKAVAEADKAAAAKKP
jgi:hypothetical protein